MMSLKKAFKVLPKNALLWIVFFEWVLLWDRWDMAEIKANRYVAVIMFV